jgi:hypothetical protein
MKEAFRMKSIELRIDTLKTLFFFSFLILTFALQFSCSTAGSVAVAPENRIPLVKNTPQQGKWESRDVVLEYEFVKEEGTIGLIIYGRTKQRLDQVAVWVLFLDKNGRLLERETVYNSGFRTKRSKARRIEGTIERAFEVPSESLYIAFQSKQQPYRGRK